MGFENIDIITAYVMKARTDIVYQMKEPLAAMNRPHYQFSVKKELFILGIRGVSAVNKVLQLLRYDSTIGENFSLQTLSREVETVLAETTKLTGEHIKKDTAKAIESMLKKLVKSPFKKWCVVVPIINLILRIPSLQLGKVQFVNTSSDSFTEVISHIQTKAITTQEVKNYLVEEIRKTFQNKVVAIAEINAIDDKQAMDNGSSEIETSLNVLRFYSRGTQYNDSLSYRMFIGKEGYVFQGRYPILLNSENGDASDEKNIKIHYQETGYFFEIVIDENVLSKMNKLSLKSINEILSKSEKERTEFEKTLIRCINFCGNGMNQTDTLGAFINFIIALETSLTNKWEPQKGLLAERTSLIIMNGSKERLGLFEEIERIYQLRSDFLHQGKSEISEQEVSILSYIVFQTIIKLIPLRNKIHNIGELAKVLNLMKFSSPSFSSHFRT
jgi:Apea-like HEPN